MGWLIWIDRIRPIRKYCIYTQSELVQTRWSWVLKTRWSHSKWKSTRTTWACFFFLFHAWNHVVSQYYSRLVMLRFHCTLKSFIISLIRVCLDRAYYWKHCSKIIFKCVNSAVRPNFKEKFVEIHTCRSREQCTKFTQKNANVHNCCF